MTFYVRLSMDDKGEVGHKVKLGRCSVAEIQYLEGVEEEGSVIEFVKNHAV